MRNLIGISGKIGSGKDTVGKIIQYLNCTPTSVNDIKHMKNFIVDDTHKSNLDIVSNYEIKKFADALKDCVCILIGCSREQLEDSDFKNTPLGPEWNRWVTTSSYGAADKISDKSEGWMHEDKEQLTPRKLLQLLGTECGRNIIHPNIWINAAFTKYEEKYTYKETGRESVYDEQDGSYIKDNVTYKAEKGYPNWIFTDMRFPNELEAIKSRDGITIRVNRFDGLSMGQLGNPKEHESETALDNSEFDYVIDNNGSIDSLIGKVQAILELEKII